MPRSHLPVRHVLALVSVLGCQADGDDTAGDGSSTTAGADELDVRVEVPAPDPRYFDIVTPEAVIPVGEEKLFCFHIAYKGGDMAVRNLEPLQGKYGHHAVILATDEPLADGTVEDCTDVQDMLRFDPLIIPSLELPEGAGAKIPAGTNLVIQSHYVNAGDLPLRIRDVLRVEMMDIAAVTTQAAMFTLNDVSFDVPPGESSAFVDCTAPQDLDILFIGGHMHEQGKRLEIYHGATDDPNQRIYLADPWRPEFRDEPPITKMFDAPLSLKAGDVIRTRCIWNNETGAAMKFPGEMCGSFGYMRGTWTPWTCVVE